MTASNPRRDAALRLLADTGMWKSNYAPPATRLLWKMGFDVPPPHFMPFPQATIVMGAFFGIFWGLGMWLVFAVTGDNPPTGIAMPAMGAGLLFGLLMAATYQFGRRKHQLPRWETLDA